MTSTINHAALITAALGTIVSTTVDGQESTFKIASLADKTGKLKNGEKGQYVVLQSQADTAVVVNLHPQAAQRLLADGEADGYKVIERVGAQAAESQTTTEATGTTEAAPAEKPAKKAKAEKPAKEPKAPKVKAEKPANEPKAPSKKARTIELFTTMKAAGKTRAEIIAAMMSDLGLSQAGANTYYQNVKSGAWVATAPVAEASANAGAADAGAADAGAASEGETAPV